MSLTPEQQAIVDEQANIFRKEVHSWSLDKHDPDSRLISMSFENLLVTSFHELLQTSIDAGNNIRGEDWEPRWQKAQMGVFAKVMEYIMASDDMKKLRRSQEHKQRLAMRFAGSVAHHVVETAIKKLGVSADFNPKLFDIERENVKYI